MPFNLKVGGAWKQGTGARVKVGGAWKTVESIQVKVGGAWKVAFTNSITPVITATVSPNPSSFTQDVTISGFVLPAPTGGTVLVRDVGSNPVGTSVNVNTSTGAYSITIPDQAVGTYNFSVTYSGFDLYQEVFTNVSVNVGTIPTTTTLTRSAATYIYNQTRVTLSGTVSPVPVTGGTVTISSPLQGTIGTTGVDTSTGAYSLLVPVRDVGSYTSISALFGGSGNYASSTSGTVAYSVTQASTSLNASTSSASVQAGNSVTLSGSLLTASTAPPPGQIGTQVLQPLSGRTVTFQGLNSSSVWINLGTGTTDAGGTATFAWTTVSGYTQIRAVYAGELNYSAQTSAGVAINIFTTIATTTSIARSAASYTYNGTRVTISGTVSPTPTGGTVAIKSGTTTIATATVNTSNGAYSAVMPIQDASATAYTVTSEYSGFGGVYLASTSGSTSYTIGKASTSITAPAGFTNNFGTAVTSSTQLTTGGVGFSGQTVVFQSSTDAGVNWSTISSATTDTSGNASVTWTPINSNTNRVRAVHNGSTNYSDSQSTAGTIYLRTQKFGEYTPANVAFSSPDDFQIRGFNVSPDQVGTGFTMPDPGAGHTNLTIYSMSCKAAGGAISGVREPGSLRLMIWNSAGTILSTGPLERPANRDNGSFGAGLGIVSSDMPDIAVTAGTSYIAGFWRQDNNSAYTTQWPTDTATGNTTWYDTTTGAAPENFQKNTTFNNRSLLFRIQYYYYS